MWWTRYCGTVRPRSNPMVRVLFLFLCAIALYGRDYAIILKDEPVASRMHTRAEWRSTAGQRARLWIATAQSRLVRELARRKIAVTGSAQMLVNAVFVRMPPDQAREVRALAGVKSVVPLMRMHRHLDQAVQLMGVPAAWNSAGGVANAGAGVKIAVLDTGIDQTHAAFQDPTMNA